MAVVTIRYAQAFADVVVGTKAPAKAIMEQLNAVVELTESNTMLHQVWDNPSVAVEQKRRVLDAIVKELGAPRILRNFIAVIIDHRRIGLLPEIAKQFERELNDRLGVAEAEVTSARELSPQERSRIEQKVAALTGKTIKASYKTDQGLRGGAVIRVGSTIYDGSVRGQLQKLREQLVGA
jgi:F-type H+-transporting ATPase subunit delta